MRKEAAAIIGNAIIWGAVIIAVSLATKGTEQAEQVRLILIGGAGGSLLVLGGTLGRKS
jgi:hypothetical protein